MKAVFSGIIYGSMGFALGIIAHAALSRTKENLDSIAPAVAAEAPPPTLPERIAPPEVPATASVEVPPSAKPESTGYVREEDISWRNDRMTARVKRLVEKVMADRDQEYESLFSELSIDPAKRAVIKEQIAHLYQKKAEAGIIMSQLMNDQAQLERYMEAISPEICRRYLDFEDRTRTEAEISRVGEFLKENGVSISAEELRHLHDTIHRERAYTRLTLSTPSSPFDAPSIPFRGRAIVPRFESLSKEMSTRAAAVLTSSDLQLNEQTMAVLKQYYAKELASYDEAIQRAVDGGYGPRSP